MCVDDLNNSDIDRNKSPLTHKITSGAQIYLKERGFKPIETEVYLEQYWLADIAAVVTPTNTELQKMRLIKTKPPYPYSSFDLMKKYGFATYQELHDSPQYKEIIQKHDIKLSEWNKTIDGFPSLMTSLVEVKISKSDFVKDNKWARPSPVNLRYLAIPCGLLKRSEFPPDWFILEFDASGRCVRLAQTGKLEQVNAEKQMWNIHQIAVRRANRTENTWSAKIAKAFNAQQTTRKQSYRISNILHAFMTIIKGGDSYHQTVDDVFKSYGINPDKISIFYKNDLQKLWGLLKSSPEQ